MSDDAQDVLTEALLDQWMLHRSTEEWLMRMIMQTRGTARSTLKRMLKGTRKMIKEIERQLFNV